MKTNKHILCSVLAGLITATASTGYAQSQPAPSANSAITWTAGGKQSKNVDVLFRAKREEWVHPESFGIVGGSW